VTELAAGKMGDTAGRVLLAELPSPETNELLDTLRMLAELKRLSSRGDPQLRDQRRRGGGGCHAAHLANGIVRGASGSLPEGKDPGVMPCLFSSRSMPCIAALRSAGHSGQLPLINPSSIPGPLPGGDARLFRLEQRRRHAHQFMGIYRAHRAAPPDGGRDRGETGASSMVVAARSDAVGEHLPCHHGPAAGGVRRFDQDHRTGRSNHWKYADAVLAERNLELMVAASSMPWSVPASGRAKSKAGWEEAMEEMSADAFCFYRERIADNPIFFPISNRQRRYWNSSWPRSARVPTAAGQTMLFPTCGPSPGASAGCRAVT